MYVSVAHFFLRSFRGHIAQWTRSECRNVFQFAHRWFGDLLIEYFLLPRPPTHRTRRISIFMIPKECLDWPYQPDNFSINQIRKSTFTMRTKTSLLVYFLPPFVVKQPSPRLFTSLKDFQQWNFILWILHFSLWSDGGKGKLRSQGWQHIFISHVLLDDCNLCLRTATKKDLQTHQGELREHFKADTLMQWNRLSRWHIKKDLKGRYLFAFASSWQFKNFFLFSFRWEKFSASCSKLTSKREWVQEGKTCYTWSKNFDFVYV